MKHIKHLKKNSGVILIEAILALTIIIVIMTALVTALISSTSNSTYSKNQTVASNYAEEGIEIARNLKEENYDEFSSFNGLYCLESISDDFGFSLFGDSVEDETLCGLIEDTYIRTIFVDPSGTAQGCKSVYVASKVTWADSKCESGDNCHEVEISSCFVNLND